MVILPFKCNLLGEEIRFYFEILVVTTEIDCRSRVRLVYIKSFKVKKTNKKNHSDGLVSSKYSVLRANVSENQTT